MKFSFIKSLQKKAKWKLLNSNTRKLTSTLLVWGVRCFTFSLFCANAVLYEAPFAEVFRYLGIYAFLTSITLVFLIFPCEATGEIISQVKRYQRISPTGQSCAKGVLVGCVPALCLTSYRAGNNRARRSQSRSNASNGSSNDGESDSGEGDPPAPPSLFSLSLRSHQKFSCFSYELNSCPFPWRSLFAPGCWRIAFDLAYPGRRWEK